jgi:polyphosphate kinase
MVNLKEPHDRLIHRDISWLAFNKRVLEESTDKDNPLLERVRFIAIFANNLDEFQMVRVAGTRRLLDSGYNKKDQFGLYPLDLYGIIKEEMGALTKKAYSIFTDKIVKGLEENGVFVKKYDQLNNEQKKFVKRYFETSLFPLITPMAIDQGHPFPVLPSKTIAFAVSLARQDKVFLALIPIPRAVPRILKLPAEKDEYSAILIEDVVRNYLEEFFRGYKIMESVLFRVIRDSELSIAEEFAPDLLKAIEAEVKKRRKAQVISLELEGKASDTLMDPLCDGLGFNKAEIFYPDGILDLSCLFELVADSGKPNLLFPVFVPAKIEYENIFDHIQESDFLIHVPFQSFQPVVDLLQGSANDPNVLGIKITLYRTGEGSAIIQALKSAAKNKKQVTVLVEIKARFDEEKNIDWVRELEEAGCHVIYGIPGMKIHSKMTLIVRKEEGRIRRYVHLATGNYNEKTARVYTDLGYFTANEDLAKDISEVFNVITGYSTPSRWKRIVSSPNDLRQFFFELIDKEMEFQKKYKNGSIIAKMNSLEDPEMIEKLYEASCAGVKIRLIVRGICCLIPKVKDLSENIRVKSVVGRFLEHTRAFVFGNNSTPQVFLSSADWMTRNFDRRVELLFELQREELREHVLKLLEGYWKDNHKSHELTEDRQYVRFRNDEPDFNVQESIITLYGK